MVWKRKSKLSTKQSIILLSLLLISLIPILAKKDGVIPEHRAHRSLTILTTHDDSTRFEFEYGFSEWWATNNGGEQIHINWIKVNNSIELRKYLDSQFIKFAKKEESTEDSFSEVDIVFGGEVADYEYLKKQNYLSELTVFDSLSYLFAKDADGGTSVPETWNGTQLYDSEKKWVGLSLSRYGICYNLDRLKELGINTPPTSWHDLTDPVYFGQIAIANPVLSSSNSEVFEVILQQEMQKYLAMEHIPFPGETTKQFEQRLLNIGWENGLKLIQKITANNYRYCSSENLVSRLVNKGEAAVGICQDYVAKTYASKLEKRNSRQRLGFNVPIEGSTLNVSPAAVLNHLENPSLANGFINFTLLPEGQLLWNTFAGNTYIYGPKKQQLRKMPIRKDLYTPDYLVLFTDPDENPYGETGNIAYQQNLTDKVKSSIPEIIRAMAVDTNNSQKKAWKSLIDANLSQKTNKILEVHFHDLNKVSYTKASNDISPSVERIKQRAKLNSRLLELKSNDFSPELMQKYYPNSNPNNYPNLIEELKSEILVLKSIDMLYMEERQRRLASQFRGSYKKTISNANKAK